MTLPGMPIRYGDPGVFICDRADVAPWEADAQSCAKPAPASTETRTAGRWLVLSTCLDCNELTGFYCKEHGPRNWWLTNWGRTAARKNPPIASA